MYTFEFEVFDFDTGLAVVDPVFSPGDIVINSGPAAAIVPETPTPVNPGGSLMVLTTELPVVEGDRINVVSENNLWSGGVEVVTIDSIRSLAASILEVVNNIPGKNTGEYDRRHTDGRTVREQILPIE